MQQFFTYLNGTFEKHSIKNIITVTKKDNQKLWSARLSNGVFGLPNCISGNRGPIAYNEIILGVGNYGLNQFVDLGFVPCPNCLPEKQFKFWETIKDTVINSIGIESLDDFTNKKINNYDPRKIYLEDFLPKIGAVPEIFILPPNLKTEELLFTQYRFYQMNLPSPKLCYYKNGKIEQYKT